MSSESFHQAEETAVDAAHRPEVISQQYSVDPGRLPVSEFAFDRPGAASPFGDDVRLPLPPELLSYVHPTEDAGPVHL
jgi:hypothetical protein